PDIILRTNLTRISARRKRKHLICFLLFGERQLPGRHSQNGSGDHGRSPDLALTSDRSLQQPQTQSRPRPPFNSKPNNPLKNSAFPQKIPQNKIVIFPQQTPVFNRFLRAKSYTNNELEYLKPPNVSRETL
ncbi:MAG TPA: hypothetical protein PLY97_09575, partial [Acidocella sp.]|nr:hypothetical protein [Acidocella sp.]